MIETEVKYRSPGNSSVLRALDSMGATRVRDGMVEDTYFAHPERDFGSSDEALRVRVTEEGTEVTYKGPRMHDSVTKAREELTTGVGNRLSTVRILERLGFVEFATVRKHRTSYLLDKIRVDVDDVEGLGQFVELELMTEEPVRARKLIEEVQGKLDLHDAVRETYLEMLVHEN